MKKTTSEEAQYYQEYLKGKRVCHRYDWSMAFLYEKVAHKEFPEPKKFGKVARWSMNDLLAWEVQHGWRREEPLQETC